MRNIQVTKTFLPPLEEYNRYLKRIWKSGQVTNQGPILKEFEEKLSKYLGVRNLHFVTNGTLALQLALQALDIKNGEVITTPFSYVATTSAILWQGCMPVFVDIDESTLCIDAEKIEAAITKKTKAILAVHVYGNPCNVNRIEEIAKTHNLKVIYDGAHAFGVQHEGKSLLDFGDVSVCSFHATKILHTIEGGAVIANDETISEKLELQKRFGHNVDDHRMLGINAKASEFQAAMGLCNLKYIKNNIKLREVIFNTYNRHLNNKLGKPKDRLQTEPNFAYYPVIFKTNEQLLKTIKDLNNEDIFPRRYFFPSLNKLKYLIKKQQCPVSEEITQKILCLPLYPELEEKDVKKICRIVSSNAI